LKTCLITILLLNKPKIQMFASIALIIQFAIRHKKS
jgi:hypothetical protein